MTNYIEISYFWLSGNWDSPQGDPSQLSRSASHMSHLATCCYSHNTRLVVSISGDLLTWVYHTRGYSYMGGLYTRDYIHYDTTHYWVQSRSLLFKQGGAGWVISPYGSFHSLLNAQPFSLNTSSETILLILRILCKAWSLVTLIVYDQLWHISLCRPLSWLGWLGPLHVWYTQHSSHRQGWSPGPGSLPPA